MSIKDLTHDEITIDGGTQAREELCCFTVKEYRDLYEVGVEFPPLVVFSDGSTNWLAGGFHRYHASKEAGLACINCDVRKGTKRDAIRYAISDNQSHGLRRSNADKRKAVKMSLADREWAELSDRAIADKVGVHHDLVSSVRSQLAESASSTSSSQDKKRRGKDGKRRGKPKRKAANANKKAASENLGVDAVVALDEQHSSEKKHDDESPVVRLKALVREMTDEQLSVAIVVIKGEMDKRDLI